MTACREWEERLIDYLLGGLNPSDARRVDRHLQSCPGCTSALEDIRARDALIERGVQQLVRQEGPSADSNAKVLAAVEDVPGRPSSFFPWAAVAATVALFLLALVYPGSRVSLPGHREGEVVGLTDWESPTASLVRDPSDDLLRPDLRFGRFYFSLDSLRGIGEPNTKEGANHEN